MDPMKNLDELFQGMKHMNRSTEVQRSTWLKLQKRIQKKKRHYFVPALTVIVMAAISLFLVFTFTGSDSGQAGPSNKALQNEVSIKAVLAYEFTGPNESYLRLQRLLSAKSEEIMKQQQEGLEFKSDPLQGSPELVTYEKFVEQTYAPFFTESTFETFKLMAFSYHFPFAGMENPQYRMAIEDIRIKQNEQNTKLYQFTAQVEYENPHGQTSAYEINGSAIFSEAGKIGRVDFQNDSGLLEAIQKDTINSTP